MPQLPSVYKNDFVRGSRPNPESEPHEPVGYKNLPIDPSPIARLETVGQISTEATAHARGFFHVGLGRQTPRI